MSHGIMYASMDIQLILLGRATLLRLAEHSRLRECFTFSLYFTVLQQLREEVDYFHIIKARYLFWQQ